LGGLFQKSLDSDIAHGPPLFSRFIFHWDADRRSVRVIGVVPVHADAMHRSLAAGRLVSLDHIGLFADGVVVRQVGRLPINFREHDRVTTEKTDHSI
jgi:threonine dehydratase